MVVVLALVAIAVVLLVLARMNELFCLSVRDGRAILVRGRIPPRLLAELRDVVANPQVRRATIRASRSENHATLSTSGIDDEGQEQRLRNVFNTFPISNLRSAPGQKRNAWLGILGIASLAWLLDKNSDL